MSAKRKGKKETKLESPTQYKVVDPISLTDLEHMHTRRGKYPTKPPPFGQSTWEEAKCCIMSVKNKSMNINEVCHCT